ncbi:protein kinase [Micromonospora marina]|uniref:Serine/threonine protein kinase n=1 Tax=Micromonospora marina TaxID=307120 RepID=A0A1C4ZD92_9ACTN|nr:Serine/threonine protein kinase [Micromonospora marina]
MDTAYRVSPLRAADPAFLGEYQMVGRIGAGGMGMVYLAEDADGSYVAVKLIHADLIADPEFRARFRDEVERSRQVPSFCTAEFIAADIDHDPPYLVVEYVDGPSLEEVVTERGPLRGGTLHSLAVGVATALTGIHRAGIIHRDLKPENVLLPPGSPKVIDFGIARSFGVTSRHTRTDDMVGTIAYMAPERFADNRGDPVSAAADVFAWGCVITYAGTGRTPFGGDSPSATAGRILTQPPHLDGLPEPLREPVRLALAKDPADRPSAPDLLAMLLGEKRDAAPVPTRRHPRWPRWRLPVVVTVVLLLVGATAGVLSVGTGPPSGSPTPSSPGAASAPAAAGTPSAAVPSSPPSPERSSPPATPSTTPDRTVTSPAPSAPPAPPATGPSSAELPASDNPTGRNLALTGTATAAAAEGPNWSAGKAVDGDPASRWSSAFTDPQWLAVDLGKRWRISEVVLHWERAYAVAYRVEISADGAAWTPVYSTATGTGGVVRIPVAELPGRYVRMYGTRRSGDYGYSLYEIEVR